MIDSARRLFQKHPRAEWIIPAAFCLILLAQLLFSVQQMSQQADESTHLYAGFRALKCGDFTFGREHPPLIKLLAAAPLLLSNPPIDCNVQFGEADTAVHWLYSQDGWWHLLSQARIASSLCALALCLVVWITARRMFGLATAVLATAFLAFEPNILAFGALVLNDVLLITLFLFTVFGFYLWTRHRSLPCLLLTGVVCGMALLTKHSAILLIPSLCLLAILEAWLEKSNQSESLPRALRNLGAIAAILVIAAAVVWCGYGFKYQGGPRSAAETMSPQQLAGMTSPDVRVMKAMRAAHLLPQPYLDGLIDAHTLVTGDEGHYILGRYYTQSPWYFFPLTFIIKCTLPFLALSLLGVAGMMAMGRERRTEILFLLLPALLYLATSMQIQMISGFKHLLPALPFLLIAAAAGCVCFARRYRWVGGMLVCLVALHAASSLRAYPNYISYANEVWGGPQNLYKHLPWTDTGQTFWQVSRYMKLHPNTPCWLDSNFFTPPDKYDMPCVLMGKLWGKDVPERMKGIVFVSASWLDLEGQPGAPLAPFYASEPTARLGGSAMLVYAGEFDTHVAAARALANKAKRDIETGNPTEALPAARQAVEVAQSFPYAHFWYGISLAANGQPQAGLLECSIARRLTLVDGWNRGRNREAATIRQQMQDIAQKFDLPLPPEVE